MGHPENGPAGQQQLEYLQGRPTYRSVMIPGQPVPFARPRPHFKKPGAFIHPKRYGDWLKDARKQLAILCQGEEPLKGPLKAEVIAIFPRPKSWGKRVPLCSHWRPVKPDLDNLIKAALDACNGFLYDDDEQVVVSEGMKIYDRERRAGLCIQVTTLVKPPSVPVWTWASETSQP